MSDSSGVILQTLDSSFFVAPPKTHPGNVYVVAYKDGTTKSFSGAPAARDRFGSRFCYVVDTAEQHATGECTVPSSVGAYWFNVEMNATWKVTDPEAVVRAKLANANEAVLGWLRDELWQISRGFAPEGAAKAEAAARSALSGGRQLSLGITLLSSATRFRADARLAEGRVELDKDSLQGELAQRRYDRLRQRLDGSDEAAVLEHLHQHPEDTGTVLAWISAGRQRNQELHHSLLKEMLDRGLITDADAQPLRDAVLGGNPLAQLPPPGPRPVASSRPSLSLPSGVSLPAGVPSTGAPSAQAPGSGNATGDAAVAAQPAPPSKANAPDSSTGADRGNSPGTVKAWRPLKKNSTQGRQ